MPHTTQIPANHDRSFRRKHRQCSSAKKISILLTQTVNASQDSLGSDSVDSPARMIAGTLGCDLQISDWVSNITKQDRQGSILSLQEMTRKCWNIYVQARVEPSLVWESIVLLALFSEDTLPLDSIYGRQDMEKLMQTDQSPSSHVSHGSGGEVTSAMGNLTSDRNMEPGVEGTSYMEFVQWQDDKKTNPLLFVEMRNSVPVSGCRYR